MKSVFFVIELNFENVAKMFGFHFFLVKTCKCLLMSVFLFLFFFVFGKVSNEDELFVIEVGFQIVVTAMAFLVFFPTVKNAVSLDVRAVLCSVCLV
jgi:hypothetical protein